MELVEAHSTQTYRRIFRAQEMGFKPLDNVPIDGTLGRVLRFSRAFKPSDGVGNYMVVQEYHPVDNRPAFNVGLINETAGRGNEVLGQFTFWTRVTTSAEMTRMARVSLLIRHLHDIFPKVNFRSQALFHALENIQTGVDLSVGESVIVTQQAFESYLSGLNGTVGEETSRLNEILRLGLAYQRMVMRRRRLTAGVRI